MLESIYNIGGGKQQSPLARYLSSVGSGSNVLGMGQIPRPGQAQVAPEVGQDGGFTQQQPGGGGGQSPFQPAGAGQNPLGPNLAHQTFDYSSDPVLQAMMSGSAVDETDADAQALAARRSVLGQYGDRGLAETVLGAGDPTLGSVSDNPDTSTSTLARLKRAYGQTVHDSEEAMNQGNLFYGGARVKKLGDLAKDEQTQEADASGAVNDALNQIGAQLGSTKAGIRTARANAEAAAADRAAQQAMLEALQGGGGGSSSTPGGADGVGAPTTTTGGVTYAGWDPNNQIPEKPDTTGMTPEQAIAAENAYQQAFIAYQERQNGPPRLA